jgi:hypothetical protein
MDEEIARVDPLDEAQAKHRIAALDAKVLSNRRPPYAIPGRLYDALVESRRNVASVTNAQAWAAAALFEACEGIDIHPAADVASTHLKVSLIVGSIQRGRLFASDLRHGEYHGTAASIHACTHLIFCLPFHRLHSRVSGLRQESSVVLYSMREFRFTVQLSGRKAKTIK